ncbi:uncharacterized protein [Chlorocebus sabaeus]|uniref:uncharacterized protein n=1 Tax=Chlorocebus sabaeus TaxID=60711 RepID=UPI003BF9FEAA
MGNHRPVLEAGAAAAWLASLRLVAAAATGNGSAAGALPRRLRREDCLTLGGRGYSGLSSRDCTLQPGLLLLEVGPGSPSCLLGDKHIVSWGYEHMLPVPESNTGSSFENKGLLGGCLALVSPAEEGRGVCGQPAWRWCVVTAQPVEAAALASSDRPCPVQDVTSSKHCRDKVSLGGPGWSQTPGLSSRCFQLVQIQLVCSLGF